MAAVQPPGREDRGAWEPVLQGLRKGMAVLAAAWERTGMPGKGMEVWFERLETAGGSAAMVQRMMEVDDEEEILELDKEPG